MVIAGNLPKVSPKNSPRKETRKANNNTQPLVYANKVRFSSTRTEIERIMIDNELNSDEESTEPIGEEEIGPF